jgi:hypothetical protein
VSRLYHFLLCLDRIRKPWQRRCLFIEPPQKTRPAEEIVVLMCALIFDGKFPQGHPLPSQ